ncbi:MAG: zinc-ribbon domain-containing protein [Pirellulales bacterium]|nr:zinc-ribbon domain-containing protein [Pirellulales bacterium]
MFCPHCGTENADDVWYCRQCGGSISNPYEATATAPGVVLPAGPVYNWLVPSVVATVFGSLCACLCCLSVASLPCGIVSIVCAAQVNGLVRTGDIAAAVRTAGLARTWCLVTFGVAGGGLLLFLAMMILPAIIDILES